MEEKGKETVRRSVLDLLPREVVEEILGHLGSNNGRGRRDWHRGVSPKLLCQLIRSGGQLGELGATAARHVEIADGFESREEISIEMSSDVHDCASYMPTLGPHIRKLTYSAWDVEARSLLSLVATFCPSVEHTVICNTRDGKRHQRKHQHGVPATANQVYQLAHRLDGVKIMEFRNLVVDSDMVDAVVFSLDNASTGELSLVNLNLLVNLDSLWVRLARNVQIVRLEGNMRIDLLALNSLVHSKNLKEISFRNVQGIDASFVHEWKPEVATGTRIILDSEHDFVITKGSRCE